MPEPRPAKESNFHWSRRHVNENVGLILTAIAAIATALAWNEARLTRNAADKNADKSLTFQQDAQKASFDQQIQQSKEAAQSQQKIFEKQEQHANQTYQLQSKSLATQIQALRLEQRPYINVTASFNPDSIVGTTASLDITLEVVGRTPAINVNVLSDSEYHLRDYRREPWIKTDNPDAWSLPFLDPIPLAAPGHIFLRKQHPFTPEDDSRRGYFFALGIVRYTDIFGKAHETPYCYTFNLFTFNVVDMQKSNSLIGTCPGFVPNIT